MHLVGIDPATHDTDGESVGVELAYPKVLTIINDNVAS